jgi:hypothetical protein
MGIVGSQLAVVAGEFIPSDSFELLDSQVKSAFIVLYFMLYIMFNDFSRVMISVVEPESELQEPHLFALGEPEPECIPIPESVPKPDLDRPGWGVQSHPLRLLGLPSGHEHYSVNNTFFAL